jgi:hypothetical protein
MQYVAYPDLVEQRKSEEEIHDVISGIWFLFMHCYFNIITAARTLYIMDAISSLFHCTYFLSTIWTPKRSHLNSCQAWSDDLGTLVSISPDGVLK